jgi:tetratricopeptide (TPR) repeat protein
MMGTRSLFAIYCAILLSASSESNAQTTRTRPDGLDGLSVAQMPLPDPLQYFELQRQAEKLVAMEDYANAEPLTERLTKDYPIDGHNWLLYARAERHLGKYKTAAEAYRHTMALLGPGVPGKAQYWLAVSEANGGNAPQALDELDRLVADDHFVDRPSLFNDDNLKPLKGNARFAEIAGQEDSSHWSRNEGWRHDIDYLASEMKRVNPDFHDRPLPPMFEQSYHDLRAAVPRLNDEQIYVGMSRLLATLNQGHTNLWPMIPATRIAFKALPVQFYIFPEGVFIVGSDTINKDLIGAQLLTIGNTPAEEALRRIRNIHSNDSGMEILWLGPMFLSLAQELKGLDIVPRTDQIEITVRWPSGSTVSRTLITTSTVGSTKLPAPPGTPSLAFSHLDKMHWMEPLPDALALYVQVNQIFDDRDETLEAFGLRLRSALQDPSIRNVILDLRNNNGGNTYDYVELLRTLIGFSQESGRHLYVVVGRGVYSAAGNLTTDLERLAAPVFIGEPTSMTGNNYGDESQLRLPYSGIWAGVTSLKWQLGYPGDLRRAIVPQVPVRLTAADYFAGRDPILDIAILLCKKH